MSIARRLTFSCSALLLASTVAAYAAPAASPTDKAFVAEVSQGGGYEVEAGKVAEQRGMAPDIKDLGVMEAHDHTLVNDKLKQIASATGVPFPDALNAKFQARLGKLKSVPAAQFDSYFITDMKQIHDNDEKAFQKESMDGSEPYRKFAHNTAVIVKRHLGAIDAGPGSM